MEYPLNLIRAAVGVAPTGFAVANDEDEHIVLSAHGYLPKYEKPAEIEPAKSKDDITAKLDILGIEHDKRTSLAKLKALLPD